MYSSFQRSNHHQNESKNKRVNAVLFVSPDLSQFLSELQVRCGGKPPPVLSGRKVIESPTKKQAELHRSCSLVQRSHRLKPTTKEKAFAEVPTDRKPAPVMDAETIRAGLKSHDKALHRRAGFVIRSFRLVPKESITT